MPTGLGDEELWLSPTVANNVNPFDDQSGQGNNGTAKNGISTVADTGSGGSYAYDFDGVNDYVTLGDVLDTEVWTTGLWSLSGWVKVKTGKTQANLMMKYFGNNREFIVDVNDRGSGIKAEFVYAGAGDGSIIRFLGGDTTLNANQWYHIAVEFDNSRTSDQMGKIWVNGVAQSITVIASAGTVTNIQDLSASLSMGAAVEGSNSGGYRSGYSDDIRAYDRALTQSEITHLATSRGVLGPPGGDNYSPFRNAKYINKTYQIPRFG